MKNIFIIPTNKPSRLIKNNRGYALITDEFTQSDLDYIQAKFQHIYITNDEEIKEGDWFYDLDTKYVKVNQSWKNSNLDLNGKKIILTTDPDLIKDGVQSIDDTFLEWFVKNPSCERVEIGEGTRTEDEWIDNEDGGEIYRHQYWCYKIIIPKEENNAEKINQLLVLALKLPNEDLKILSNSIVSRLPKEEPKQETLEEFIKQSNTPEGLDQFSYDKGLEDGVKWQQEQDKNKYSEEEVRQMFNRYNEIIAHRDIEEWQPWIEKQFKKKFG